KRRLRARRTPAFEPLVDRRPNAIRSGERPGIPRLRTARAARASASTGPRDARRNRARHSPLAELVRSRARNAPTLSGLSTNLRTPRSDDACQGGIGAKGYAADGHRDQRLGVCWLGMEPFEAVMILRSRSSPLYLYKPHASVGQERRLKDNV